MTRLRCLKPPLVEANPGGWKPDAIRGSRHQRGYGAAWDRIRKRILDRDEHLCQPCLKAERITVGTHVDHIVPKAQGGSDADENLQTICVECHRVKSSREGTGGVVENEKESHG